MNNHKLLIANRGEIAIRIVNAAYELGIPTVTVFPADDRATLHTKKSDETYQLEGHGVSAYLDIEQTIVDCCKKNGLYPYSSGLWLFK